MTLTLVLGHSSIRGLKQFYVSIISYAVKFFMIISYTNEIMLVTLTVFVAMLVTLSLKHFESCKKVWTSSYECESADCLLVFGITLLT